MSKQIIPIVFSSDHNYAMPLGVVIQSLVDNKKEGYIVEINILDGGLTMEDKKKLNTFINDEIKIKYINININNFSKLPENGYFTLAVYFRLIAPELLPYDKILYIDCDMIILVDIKTIYDLDLQGHVLATVPEMSGPYLAKYFFRSISRYFNAGFLLIDSIKWKKFNVFSEGLKVKDVIFNFDQDILNHIFEKEWLELDRSFNFQVSSIIYNENKIDAKIIHFIGAKKPWQYISYNPYKKYFIKYLRKSPWKDYKYPDKNVKTWFKRTIIMVIVFIYRHVIKKVLPAFMIIKLKDFMWVIFNFKRHLIKK